MKIVAGNVTAKFLDLTDIERKKLDSAFAITDQKLFFIPQTRRLIMSGRIDGKIHFFQKKGDTLPTGLLPKVMELFPNAEVTRTIEPEHWKIWERAKTDALTVEVDGQTFRQEDQRPAIISAITNMRGILECATNYGKTPVGAGIVKALQVPSLWVIHRRPLLIETSKRLEDYLGIPVGRIGAGYKKTGTLVTVGIDKSILNQGSEWLKQFNCVIFDEAQHLCSATQLKIANGCINAPWRIAMSGSFPKDKSKRFYAMSGADATLLYKVKNEELIDAGLSAKPKVYIKPLRYPPQVFGRTLYGFEYQEAQEYCIYKNEFFNNIVAADVEKWVNDNKTTLVFAGRRDQGRDISDKLNLRGIKNVFIDNKTPDFARTEYLNKFGRKEIPVIVSVMVLTEGINCPSMGCIIMASGKKSDAEVLQKVGRSLRQKKEGANEAIVQDYNFIGSKYTEKHSKMRRKIYEDQKFEIIDEQEINLG